jgi:hypothetical protein
MASGPRLTLPDEHIPQLFDRTLVNTFSPARHTGSMV